MFYASAVVGLLYLTTKPLFLIKSATALCHTFGYRTAKPCK